MKFIILMLVVLPITAFTKPVLKNGICNSEDISSVNNYISPNEPKLGKFIYKYRFIKTNNPEKTTTVIYFPGGPGRNSIYDHRRSVPEGYNIIQTDPRGSGCNELKSIDNKYLSTELYAEDIIQVIKKENLKNYVLFGDSYGTMVSTILAAKLSELDLPQPKAIIIEGVVGQYVDKNQNFNYSELAWNMNFESFSKKTKDYLSTSDEATYGLDNYEFLNVVFSLLYLGDLYPFELTSEEILLEYVKKEKGEEINSDLKQMMDNLWNSERAEFGENFYHAIWCNEVTWSSSSSIEYKNGQLHTGKQNPCEVTYERPYDSKKWKVKTDIIYIHGERDASVNLSHAKYHYDNQFSSTNKTVLFVKGAGHKPFQLNLIDCNETIWHAILNGTSIEDATNSCAAPIEFSFFNEINF